MTANALNAVVVFRVTFYAWYRLAFIACGMHKELHNRHSYYYIILLLFYYYMIICRPLIYVHKHTSSERVYEREGWYLMEWGNVAA